MNEVTRAEAGPLISALEDPSAAVRVAALRALVRLPLPREGWVYIGHRVMTLLQKTPAGESFDAQTVDGIPYRELIDAAAFVPTKAVRGRLHELLQDSDMNVRRTVARVLTRMGDPRAVPQLVSELSDPIPECRADAAENLSLLDVSEHRVAVQEVFRQETDGEARFWMALSLARLGETLEIAQIFQELNQGTLDLPRSSWGDPVGFTDRLNRRGPFPEAVRDLLSRISRESEEGPVVQIARDLLMTGRSAETPPTPDFQPLPPPTQKLKRLTDLLARSFEDRGPVEFVEKFSEEVIPEILQEPLVAYLPPDLAPRLVPALFRAVMRWGVGFANGIVMGVWYLGNAFVPPLHELFECYLELWKEAETGQGWPGALRWQLAWTVSRAGTSQVLSGLGSRLKSENELERVVTARLIEDSVLYVRQPGPALFGGGGPPADLGPPTVELIDSEEMHEAIVGAEIEAVEPEMRKQRRKRDPGVRRKAPVRKRVVNTGFSTPVSPDEPVKKTMPLKVGQKYFFWLEIGKAITGSIEETPTDIPQVPAKARLTVAVFGYKDGIKVRRGADVGELEVQPDGTVSVVRQPLDKPPLKSRRLTRRLFFPVQVPPKSGTFRMRCHIYWGQILLQSRIIDARAVRTPRRATVGQRPLRSVLDYTLSQTLSPGHLNALTPHRLSIMLNRNDNGTHSFLLLGMKGDERFKQDDVRFREGELHGLIQQARGTLRIASWNNADEWREGIAYKYKNRQRDLPRLQSDLCNLARWGYKFYAKVRSRFKGEEKSVKDFESAMLEPGFLQIAMKESPSYVLPAALIYDYPLDVGASGYSLCPAFQESFERGLAMESTECFHGNCPTRKKQENRTKEMLQVICPSGFWGFRHYMGMPLSIKRTPDIPPNIIFRRDLRMAFCVATDLQLLPLHAQAIRQLRPGIVWNYADTRDKVFGSLKQPLHMVYFYCHGGYLRDGPYLQVGPRNDPGLIDESNLSAYEIVWDDPRPLIFLNGCHTTAVDPLQALEFITPLVQESRCAGVIGTEITIFEELATVFGEECLRRFLAGQSIGESVRGARLKLLGEGNPLGLVYIPYVMAGLKLLEEQAGST